MKLNLNLAHLFLQDKIGWCQSVGELVLGKNLFIINS